MPTLRSLMTNIPPINAMPYKKHLNTVEMAAKIGKYIPHPVVQTAAHAADLAVKVIKQVDKISQKRTAITPKID